MKYFNKLHDALEHDGGPTRSVYQCGIPARKFIVASEREFYNNCMSSLCILLGIFEWWILVIILFTGYARGIYHDCLHNHSLIVFCMKFGKYRNLK